MTKLSFQQKGEAVIEMRLGKIRFEVEGLAIADCRLGQIALPTKGEPEGVEWFGVVRLEVESSAITGQRFVRPVLARQELTQVIMRFGINPA